MKKFLTAILLLCLVFALVACDTGTTTPPPAGNTPGEAREGDLKIGLTMQTLGGAYFAAQEETFIRVCQEKGIEYMTADAGGDVNKELENVEAFITAGCNVIVINPVHAESSVAATKICEDAGVAVFIMDNSIAPSASYVSMIQSDNYTLGTLVGADIAAHFGTETINLGFLSGNEGNTLGVARRMGTLAGIIEYQLMTYNASNVNILTQGWGGWNQAQGQEAAEGMLTTAPEINCIFAENDDMAQGALAACEARNRTDIVLCGADGNKTMYQMIIDGKALATGRNNPDECAATVIETIIKWWGGENVPSLVYLTPVSVNASNVNNYFDPNSTF